MTERSKQPSDPPTGPPPRDELDGLLRDWHTIHAQRAAAGRDRLIERLAQERERSRAPRATKRPAGTAWAIPGFDIVTFVRRIIMNRYSPAAASLLVLVALIAVLMPSPQGNVYAQHEIMVPDGGRLDALDEEGNILGPCPLKHTDVDVQVSGFFSRVTVTQTYHNPYEKKIEAVYSFPLSHRAAVDRMTMTIDDRIVVGEVKERQLARQIYEAARAQGYVASLLEQERPNIFTQSVANIEPDVEVIVEISYVEVLQSTDGIYRFDFPMVVGPRYIPGAPTTSPSIVPAELTVRRGLILLGPAKLTVGAAGEVEDLGTLQTGKLHALLGAAQPIKYPGDTWWGRGDETGGAGQPGLWYRFEAEYCDSSKEFGELYTDGTAQLNGRWLFTDPATIKETGTGFAQDTNQVPDASRITPQPVRPGKRAGHDISVTVTIDSGGPGLLDINSDLHEIVRSDEVMRDDAHPRMVTLALANKKEIPNRDFVLSWRQTADTIQEATFTHTSDTHGDFSGGFFTLILQPPDRVEDADVPPRELIFVMDTSGSMRGFPIEKSKEVMTRAIDAMRPADTFNIITFAGHTAILWDKPRHATEPNRAEAKTFVETRQGGGGTEMMTAIEAALVQTVAEGPVPLSPRQLANLPADGREAHLAVGYEHIHITEQADLYRIPVGNELSIALRLNADLPPVLQPKGVTVRLHGRWLTEDGRRIFIADRVWAEGLETPVQPMRIVLFLTDGQVGNDMAIIDAVKNNAHTTRVFSFGIGNSVNRYLMQGMARAGRGEVEFVLLETDADDAVTRFTKRVETPVLTDIELAFSDGLQVTDLLPGPNAVPDLFDAKPLVIHGRYATPGTGTLTIRGRTGAGPYRRTIDLELPETQAGHDVIATVWARTKVDQVLTPHLKAVQEGYTPEPVRQQVIALGEQFQIMTQYTSFVAVEKSRMTIGGKPVLVAVPIEMPAGVSYQGVFGEVVDGEDEDAIFLGVQLRMLDEQDVVFFEQATNHASVLRALEATNQPSSTPSAPGSKGMQMRRNRRDAAAEPLELKYMSAKEAADQINATMTKSSSRVELPRRGRGMSEVDADRRAAGTAGRAGAGEPASNIKPQSPGSISLPWQQARPVGGEALESTIYSKVRVVPIPGKNSVAVHAPPEYQALIRDVISELDKPDRQNGDEQVELLLGDIPLVGEVFKDASRPVPIVAGRPIFAEHVAMGVGSLVAENEIDDAKTLADMLAEARGDYEIGVKMRDALADESLDEAKRDATIAELSTQAESQLKAALTEARREARLRRVLDARLHEMVAQLRSKADRPEDSAAREESLLLTVLVTVVDDETKQALTEAGLTIEATAKSLPIVVGTAAVAHLEALAVLDFVRRIEPTKMD